MIVKEFVHPPLHGYLPHVWMNLFFGFEQLQDRWMSLLFGSPAIVMMYLLARRRFPATAGLIAASGIDSMFRRELFPGEIGDRFQESRVPVGAGARPFITLLVEATRFDLKKKRTVPAMKEMPL